MSAEHCGVSQETPYCAYCGECLDPAKEVIQGLKRHMELIIRNGEKVIAEYDEGDRLYKSRSNSVKKWKARLAALEVLMNK